MGDKRVLEFTLHCFQRNLPDLSASMVRSPSSQSASYTAYPLLDERPVEERPPWEPRTRFEMERDVSEMQVKQKMLGGSVSWIVDTLLLDEGETPTEEEAKTIKARKREALESLAYVRDVLLGNVTMIEAERLISDEEVKKRKEKARKEQEEAEKAQQAAIEQTVISPPQRSHPAAPPSVAHARPVASRRVSPQPSSSAPRSNASPFISPRGEMPNPLSPTTSSSSSGTPSANISRAPWNYTRSEFSSAISPVPVPSLAPPPRASTATSRSPSHATLASYPPPPPAAQSQSTGQTAREQAPLQKVHHDPLGVLR